MSYPAHPLLVWVDAQIPPAAARWIQDPGKVRAVHVFDLGLARAEDPNLFERARAVGAVILTKDHDLVQLQDRLGPLPKIIWLTCGSVSNPQLREILASRWTRALELVQAGEFLVEIGGARAAADEKRG